MPAIKQVSFTDPYSADEYDLQRRQALADALQRQSMMPMGGTEMAGPIAIRRSPLEGAAKLMQGYSAGRANEDVRNRQKELYDQYQRDYQQMVSKGLAQLQGTPATPGSSDAADNYTPPQAAVAPDPAAAIATFGTHPGGAALMPLAMQAAQRQQLIQSLRGMGGQQPQGGMGGQQSQAGMPQGGQVPQGQSNAVGGPAGGVPMEAWLAADPSGKSYMEALAKQNAPINVREGGAVYVPGSNAPMFQNFKTQPGQMISYGPNGPTMGNVPGAIPSMAAVTQSQSAAKEAGAAPYQPGVVQTEGAPTLMTRQQQIEAATGQPMPVPSMQQGNSMETVAPPRPGSPEYQAYQQVKSGAVPSSYVPLPTSKVPGLRLQDQGAGAEQRAFGQHLGEYTSTVQNDAAKAAVSNRYLDNMELAANDIRLGKLAPAQSSLTQWAQAFGLPVSDEMKKQAGSTQALTSMAIKLAGQATRQSDAQPSQLQYFKMLESMPNEVRTEDGFRKIVAYLRDANNYNIAKMQNLQEWRQQHLGSAEGFEAAWPKIADNIPFVWNQGNKAASLKGIVNSGNQNDPLGIRKYNAYHR